MTRVRPAARARFALTCGAARPAGWQREPLFDLVMVRYRVWLDALAAHAPVPGRTSRPHEARVEIATPRGRALGGVFVIEADHLGDAHRIARSCPLLLLPGGFADVRPCAAAATRTRADLAS